jgi:DNA-binding NarL/FixJ family response regulator
LSPRRSRGRPLVARSLSNGRIAQRLELSDHTVHRHVANILVKLEVPSRSAAVAAVARMGLLREEPV